MANLAYRIRRSGEDIIVLELSGFVNASTARFFEEILDGLIEKGATKVVLDFYHVNYMNSTGIGILFNYSESFREKGGGLTVVRVPQEVGVTMQLLGITDVVPCLKSREEGIKALQAPAKPVAPSEAETVSQKPGGPPPHKRSPVYFYKTRDFKPVPESSSVLLVVPKVNVFTDILRMRLQKPRGRFHVVHAAEEALEKMGEINPDVLILEDRVTDSEEFLKTVKVEQGRGLVSVIKLYPNGTLIDSFRNFKIWENDYLVEPFEMMELFALAEAELRRIPKDRTNLLQQVHFRFRTDTPNMNMAFELVSNLVTGSALLQEDATALAAAYREAVDNGYRHGHQRSEEKVIDTVFLLEPSQLSITVEDEGEGFDSQPHLEKVSKLSPGEQAKIRKDEGGKGGLGITLMARCTDTLEFLGKGNVVRMVKKLR
ncbi:MAG: STAS domain-containing protein [Planctomycetota bacterium]|jgi:anti-anti-sigma factor